MIFLNERHTTIVIFECMTELADFHELLCTHNRIPNYGIGMKLWEKSLRALEESEGL